MRRSWSRFRFSWRISSTIRKRNKSTEELKKHGDRNKNEIIEENKKVLKESHQDLTEKISKALNSTVQLVFQESFEQKVFDETGYTLQQIKIFAKQASKQSESYLDIGNSYFLLNDFELAVTNFTAGIENSPTELLWQFHLNRAIALDFIESDYKIEDLKNLNSKVYYNYHQIFEKSKYDKSIEDFSKAIELNPSYPTYFGRGKIYKKLKHYPEAIEDFSKAIELNEKFADAYQNRGIIYCELGLLAEDKFNNRKRLLYFERSSSDFDRSIELEPKNPIFRTNRAKFYNIQESTTVLSKKVIKPLKSIAIYPQRIQN